MKNAAIAPVAGSQFTPRPLVAICVSSYTVSLYLVVEETMEVHERLAANVDILMSPKSQFWRHVFVSSRHVGPTQKHVADIMRCRASFCVSYFVSCRQLPTCCIGALHMSWWGTIWHYGSTICLLYHIIFGRFIRQPRPSIL